MAEEIPPPPPGSQLESVPLPPKGAVLEPRPTQEVRSSTVGVNPIIDDRAYAPSNLGIARASLATDVKTQIKRYAEQFGVPESYFGVINGEVVRWVPEDKAYAKVVPSVTGHGVVEGLKRAVPASAALAGDAFPAVGGAVGGVVGGTGGASIATAGLGAAGGDLVRQGLDKALAPGESVLSKTYDLPHAIGEGVAGGVGQAAGLGLSKLIFRGNPLSLSAAERIHSINPTTLKEWAELAAEAERRGVQLSVGQVSQLPSLMQRERQLGRMPETTDMVHDFQQTQRNTQIPNAVKSELDTIAPASGREAQIGNFRSGADAVVEKAVEDRSAMAKPEFAKALDGKSPFYTPELKNIMRRPSMKAAWENAQKFALEEDRKLPQFLDDEMNVKTAPDWRAWEYIKRGLDTEIDKHKNQLTGKLDGEGYAIWRTQKDMLAILDKHNPDWAAARAKYGSATDAVNMILDGGTGFLKNLNGLDRQAIVEKVFNGPNMLPGEITRMKQQFDVAGHSADWNGGLRAFIEGRLEQSMKTTAIGERGNVPGKLYAQLWGDEPQRKVLSAALGDPGRVDSMNKLMNVLKAAAHSLPEGSPTATDSVALKESTIAPTVRGVAKLLNGKTYLLELGDTLIEGWDALRTATARRQLAEYMLSKDGIASLNRMRSLNEKSYKAVNATANILVNAGIVKALPNEPDFRAPAELQK